MTKKNVVALGGDGIGPEIVEATCSILVDAGFGLNIVKPLHGEAALEKGKEPFHEETKKFCDEADAILFGASGGISESILFYIRWIYDNYINLRPIKYYEGVKIFIRDASGIDFVIIRELSEGLYPGQEGDLSSLTKIMPDFKGKMGRALADYGNGKFALRIISERGIKRLASYACEYTKQRKKDGYPGKLTCVTKSNILKETCGLFQRLIEEEVKKFPDITYEHYYVDDAARRLIRYPRDFDVIVTSNLFGDILSDEAAELVGGLGLAGSGSFGGKVAYFEPAHGSAPDIAGKNIANPTATILSAQLMLEFLQMHEEAKALDRALAAAYKEGKSLTKDQGGNATTAEFAEAVLRNIK